MNPFERFYICPGVSEEDNQDQVCWFHLYNLCDMNLLVRIMNIHSLLSYLSTIGTFKSYAVQHTTWTRQRAIHFLSKNQSQHMIFREIGAGRKWWCVYTAFPFNLSRRKCVSCHEQNSYEKSFYFFNLL